MNLNAQQPATSPEPSAPAQTVLSSSSVTNSGLGVGIIDLTPQLAAHLLTMNAGNRPVSPFHVGELARRMESGQWQLNGEALVTGSEAGFPAPDDSLLNGQHRCHAVIRSGVTIKILHVSGAKKEVNTTFDGGKIRTHGDALAMMGESYATCKAASVKLIDRYLVHSMRTNTRYSANDVVQLLSQYEDLDSSVLVCRKSKRLAPASILVAAHYLFATVDRKAADEFMDKTQTGVGLEEGSPILLLRKRLLDNAASQGKQRLAHDYIFGITIKAWNAFRSGRKLRTLRYTTNGDQAEEFPLISP